jgi:hypothetical protein
MIHAGELLDFVVEELDDDSTAKIDPRHIFPSESTAPTLKSSGAIEYGFPPKVSVKTGFALHGNW